MNDQASTTPPFRSPDELKAILQQSGKTFLLDAADDPTDEYAHFYFVGLYGDKEVIFDATLYTLRLAHESELFEAAEERALQAFPQHRDKIKTDLYREPGDDGEEAGGEEDPVREEIGLFMAEVIAELEEEERVRVKETVDIHHDVDLGVGLDIALHVKEVNEVVIERFVHAFLTNTLMLDPILYTFQSADPDDDDAGVA